MNSKSFWAQRVEELKADPEYVPLKQQEQDLREQLEEIKPELFQELQAGGELEDYLTVQVQSAMDLQIRLLQGGVDPFEARWAAQRQIADLLRTKEDDLDDAPVPDRWVQEEEN